MKIWSGKFSYLENVPNIQVMSWNFDENAKKSTAQHENMKEQLFLPRKSLKYTNVGFINYWEKF